MGDRVSHEPGDSDHYFVPPSPPGNTDYRHARWSRPTRVLRTHATDQPPTPPTEHDAPTTIR